MEELQLLKKGGDNFIDDLQKRAELFVEMLIIYQTMIGKKKNMLENTKVKYY